MKNSQKKLWEESFKEQKSSLSYNLAPVEALVRNISYYIRNRYSPSDYKNLRFLEMGCGTGPNLIWLGQLGIRVSGVDISSNALDVARRRLQDLGLDQYVDKLMEESLTEVPEENESYDGIIEACVFQHLNQADREKAFKEIKRLLKPGGLFVGYMLNADHSVFQLKKSQQLVEDPGTLILKEGKSKIFLTNMGLCHFFYEQEFHDLLKGFSVIDPSPCNYYLPIEEAQRRGYSEYQQSMWTVYAVK